MADQNRKFQELFHARIAELDRELKSPFGIDTSGVTEEEIRRVRARLDAIDDTILLENKDDYDEPSRTGGVAVILKVEVT